MSRVQAGGHAKDADLGWVLMRLATRLERLQTEALAWLSEPVTFRQFRILTRVQEGNTSLTRLAQAIRRSMPTVSASVDTLVKRGLLTREPSPGNRRQVTLAVTDRGRAVLDEGRVTLEVLTSKLTADLSQSDRKMLTRTLSGIYGLAGTYLNPST